MYGLDPAHMAEAMRAINNHGDLNKYNTDLINEVGFYMTCQAAKDNNVAALRKLTRLPNYVDVMGSYRGLALLLACLYDSADALAWMCHCGVLHNVNKQVMLGTASLLVYLDEWPAVTQYIRYEPVLTTMRSIARSPFKRCQTVLDEQSV